MKLTLTTVLLIVLAYLLLTGKLQSLFGSKGVEKVPPMGTLQKRWPKYKQKFVAED